MFKKLRNRLIIVNVTITTIVLFFAFATIYFAMQSSSARRPLPPNEPSFSQFEKRFMDEHVNKDRQETLAELLWILIIIGLIVEALVVIISYRFAEIAIQPIKKSYEKQKHFIANASHEIKTPLAAISANLEAAEIENNHWIDNTIQEVQKLNQLNQELLDLARADGVENFQQQKELTKVDSVIREVAKTFEARIKAKKLQLRFHLDKKLPKINLNAKDLRQLLTILIDNAIKYGESEITITYTEQSVTIENDGAKIPKKQLEQIFERFYQVDKSSEGSGLGLAIAQTLAKNNKWNLAVSSGDKTTFTLELI